MSWLLLAVAGFWWLLALSTWRQFCGISPLPKDLPAGEAPAVTVVVAARDEAARIESTVRGLLAQEHVKLKLVVVNDRSSDETGAILDRLAGEDERLVVVHLQSLPDGWLGKCHACHVGARQADTPWLLFTDGDVAMAPTAIAAAVHTAQRDQADHLSLWPAVDAPGALTQAILLAWSQCLVAYSRPASVNRDRGRSAIGVGAFNLVRTQAYRNIGGHEPLRMEVIDDVKLGLVLRRAGFRLRNYNALELLEVPWAVTPEQAIHVTEKNWFAGVDFSTTKAILVLSTMAAVWILGLTGPLLDPFYGTLALSGWLAPMVPGWRQARQAGWTWRAVLLTPIGYLAFLIAGVNSTFKTLRQGGIRWRETFYSLDELRAGLVK